MTTRWLAALPVYNEAGSVNEVLDQVVQHAQNVVVVNDGSTDGTAEQLQTANELVDYSLLHHPVKDVFADDPNGKTRQREFRLTGTLGEIVFADA